MRLNELQQALFNEITQATGLPVFSNPAPQDTPYPYATIDDIEASAWDTDNSLGFSSLVQIHTFHQSQSRADSYAAQGAIYSALHYNDSMIMSSYHLVGCVQQFATVRTEANQEIQHGIQRFLITIEEL